MQGYCDSCNRIVDCIINEAPSLFGKVKGRYYIYKGKQARCPNCGRLVSVHEINEYNLEQLNKKMEDQKCKIQELVG